MAEVRYIPWPKEAGDDSAETRYKQQRAENERLKAVEREVRLSKARGELIERAVCLRQAAHVMTSIRQRLLLVPTLAARKIPGLSDAHAAKLIIDAEIRAALEELADFPKKVAEAGEWERRRK
jgi:phage terminase Nu1 subunit (DNA packaging protein)